MRVQFVEALLRTSVYWSKTSTPLRLNFCWCISEQNRRQKVVNRGALCLCGGTLRLCRGGLTFKFNKNSTDSQCFIFQFGGAWSFVWGAKPTKAPRGDGTVSKACKYKNRNHIGGHDDFLLNCTIGWKKRTADLALIATRFSHGLLQEIFMSKWWLSFKERLELH